MKRNLKIFSIIIPSLIALFTLGNKGLELYKNFAALKVEKTELTEQLVDSHMTINRYENELGEIVEEKEECEVTQKILRRNKNKEIKEANETISEYDELFDSVTTELILKEQKEEIKAANVPNIVINQITIPGDRNILKNIEPVKSFKSELFLIERTDKKRLLKRIFAKLRKKN